MRRDNLFINSGSASNACETPARQPGAKGEALPRAAARAPASGATTPASWARNSRRRNAYVTGLRNSGGQAFDAAGQLFAVQHGRDQLPDELAEAV